MAVTAKIYGKSFLSAYDKEIDYIDEVFKVMLTLVGYTPDQDTHDYKDDVGSEASGTGYVAGGNTLATKTLAYDPATNKVKIDAADSQWAASNINAVRTAVVYGDAPAAPSDKPLLVYNQESVDISSAGGNFDVIWAAAGILEITVA